MLSLLGVNPVTVVADYMGECRLCANRARSHRRSCGDAGFRKRGQLQGDQQGQREVAFGVADVGTPGFSKHTQGGPWAGAGRGVLVSPAVSCMLVLQPRGGGTARGHGDLDAPDCRAATDQGPRAGGVSQAPVEHGEQNVPLRGRWLLSE